MKITLFKSAFCPRCLFAGRVLYRLRIKFPDLEIEAVEVITNPLKARQAGVRMIPALKIEDEILAGIFLTKGQITEFIARHYKESSK